MGLKWMTRPVGGRDRAGLKNRHWRQGKRPADGGWKRHRLLVAVANKRFNAENHHVHNQIAG